MSWAKLDDQFHSHRKVDALLEADELRGAAAVGLWVCGLSFAAGQPTDGELTHRAVKRLMPEQGLELAELLVHHGLWDETDGGWQIHDYLDYNPSAADIEKRRKERSEAGRRGAESRWQGTAHSKSHGKRHGGSNGTLLGGVDAPSRPVPSPTAAEEEKREPARSSATDPALAAIVEILRTAPRLELDADLTAIANVVAAYPAANHTQAAHIAVANASDPNYKWTDAGRALRYAIQELERNAPRSNSQTKTTSASSGAALKHADRADAARLFPTSDDPEHAAQVVRSAKQMRYETDEAIVAYAAQWAPELTAAEQAA